MATAAGASQPHIIIEKHAQPNESIYMSSKVLPLITMTTQKIPRENNKGKD